MLFISNTKKIVLDVITYPFIIHNNFKVTLIQLLNIPVQLALKVISITPLSTSSRIMGLLDEMSLSLI